MMQQDLSDCFEFFKVKSRQVIPGYNFGVTKFSSFQIAESMLMPKDDEYEEWTGINDTPNRQRDNLSEDFDIGTFFILSS